MGVASLQRIPIQIRWASTDMSTLETHPLTPGLHYPYTATVTTTPNPSNASSTNGSPASASSIAPSSLSTGAKIGIGVAVPVGVILLLILSILFFLKRRQRKRSPTISKGPTEKTMSETDPHADAAPEVCSPREVVAQAYDEGPLVQDSSAEAPTTALHHEASGSQLHEAPANIAATELPARTPSTRTRQTVTGSIANSPRELSAEPARIELEEPAAVATPSLPVSAHRHSLQSHQSEEAASTTESAANTLDSLTDPLVASLVGRDEIAVLKERQARLQAKKNRLLELQRLEEEEEGVRQQIARAEARSRQGAG
jgi:hypothetical protein